MFDMEQSYKQDIKKTCQSIIAGIIAKIRHFVNRNTITLIYCALVYPYLIYGNLIWGNTYKTKINKPMKIKKNVRLMTFNLETKRKLPWKLMFDWNSTLSL